MSYLFFMYAIGFLVFISLVFTAKFIWSQYKLKRNLYINKPLGGSVLGKDAIQKQILLAQRELHNAETIVSANQKEYVLPPNSLEIEQFSVPLKYGMVQFEDVYEDDENSFPFKLPDSDMVVITYSQEYNAIYVFDNNNGLRRCNQKVLLKEFKVANGGKGLKYGDKIPGVCISFLSSSHPFYDGHKPDEQTGLFHKGCLEAYDNQPKDRTI